MFQVDVLKLIFVYNISHFCADNRFAKGQNYRAQWYVAGALVWAGPALLLAPFLYRNSFHMVKSTYPIHTPRTQTGPTAKDPLGTSLLVVSEMILQ